MPKVTQNCRVCGKQYTACYTPNWGVFRWKDVACSPECGAKYLKMIQELDSKAKDENPDAEE